jgi:hypothetical protein
VTPDDPTSYNHPLRHTLNDSDCGQLGAALLALTREVWVLTDRQMVMEAVLARRGIDITAEIEALQPDEDLRRQMDERGARLVANVMDALAGLAKD